ncbi:MAG: hypothetical protein P0Y49_02480 [Candidatus Pedobacter colombiensis]|uniref:Uncharacterized protein n=1 Tax=Candidatus Pedobacter colombiensis TaxID=3121371 RepID=A0AAJ5W8S2_9SPHI|nr:hypothetical protein [Pedobacter sp.]WEK20019.1 MAG: hypothetical protein P0Y49_02480 [Pedobacter sp.]
MKKLLLSSAVLLLFSVSMLLFQISCKKEVSAQSNIYTLSPASTSKLGGIIVGNGLSVTSDGTLSVSSTSNSSRLNKIIYTKRPSNSSSNEFWSANYDGTNQKKINISLPTNLTLGDNVELSPDGLLLIFQVYDNKGKAHIYSCNVDGSNVKLIIDGSSSADEGVRLTGAY